MSSKNNEMPVWHLLSRGAHIQTLNHNQTAPVGLLEMINPVSNVLDVGCFCGGTGRWLKAKFPSVRLSGVEMLTLAADKAKSYYDYVHAGTFETFLPENQNEKFDAIVAADVLEHMYDPWSALIRMREMLEPGGALYISMPNAGNLRISQDLLAGSWNYVGAGLLDITHIRFFTKRTLYQMLEQTGWRVERCRHFLDSNLMKNIGISDLENCKSITLGKLTLNDLTKDEVSEMLTFQYFIKVKPV